jgi:cytochrome o ubiquinol oxidase subunit III
MNAAIHDIEGINTIETEQTYKLETKTFGFWIYLMSDLVLFSTLFSTFAVVGHNFAGGITPKELFHLPYLFGETMLLLTSSATFGISMVAMHSEKKKLVLIGLLVTFLLGLGFIAMELNEFINMINSGYVPAKSGFLSAFFTLVGTHGTHVLFGLIWMSVMFAQIVKMGLTNGVRSRLMRLSLFWHFLDIVWIGVFTFVYLLGLI